MSKDRRELRSAPATATVTKAARDAGFDAAGVAWLRSIAESSSNPQRREQAADLLFRIGG